MNSTFRPKTSNGCISLRIDSFVKEIAPNGVGILDPALFNMNERPLPLAVQKMLEPR